MQPLKDLLLIEMNEQTKEKASDSGFLWQAPKWAKPENVAKVTAKGPLVDSVGVGDSILINPYAVIDTTDVNVKLIHEKDVLCLLSQEV